VSAVDATPEPEHAPEPEPPAPRRTITPHRVGVAVMVLIMLAGSALLVLPYTTEVDVDLGPSGLFKAEGPVEGRCEPPLLDAFHGQTTDLLEYAPGKGIQHDGWLTGSWCSPEALQRTAIGGGIALFGMCGLLTLEVLRQRRLRQERAADEDDDDEDAPTG